MVGAQLPPYKNNGRYHRRKSQHRDIGGGKPVFGLPFLEHDLETADADGQQQDPPIIDRFTLRIAWVLPDKGGYKEGGDSAYGYIHIKYPGPGEVIRYITTDRRTDSGAYG